MKVYFPSFVRNEIRKTAKYIKKEFGTKSEGKFLQEVKYNVKLLGANPYIGSVELSLPNKTIVYRSIIVANRNKLVYTIKDNIVDVIDFWDCRRNPQTPRHANRIQKSVGGFAASVDENQTPIGGCNQNAVVIRRISHPNRPSNRSVHRRNQHPLTIFFNENYRQFK